jgi:flagellar FliJ protein
MKKPEPLDRVIEVATLRRDDARVALAQALQEQQQADKQGQQLQDYVVEAQTRWSQRAAQGVTPELLHHHRQFMARIDQAVEFQKGVVQRLRLQVEHRQHELLLAERALAGVGRYNDRRQQSWQHHLDRQEQKSNDEMAAHLHRRANNPLHPQGRDTV